MAFGDFVGESFDRANAFWLSIVRTYTPYVAGAVISFLVSLGLELPEGSEASLGALIFAVGSGAWYLVARLLEEQGTKRGIKWMSNIGGYMLGSRNQPEYITEKKQDGEPEGP